MLCAKPRDPNCYNSAVAGSSPLVEGDDLFCHLALPLRGVEVLTT